MRERNAKISFWTTAAEKKRIKNLARRTGMGDGEYLRLSALGKTIYQVEELKPMLHELKGIGRNLNQLAVLAHEGRVQTVHLQAAVEMLGQNYEAINRLYADTDAIIASGNRVN